LAIAIEVRGSGADALAEGTGAAEGDVRVRGPGAAAAVAVLEPGVPAEDVLISVAIEIGDPGRRDRAVDRGSDRMRFPGSRNVAGDRVPAEVLQARALVSHQDGVRAAVAVEVRDQDVVRPRRARIERTALELRLTRLLRVPVPDPARDQVREAVSIDVQRRQAHVRQVVRPDEVLLPAIRPLELEP